MDGIYLSVIAVIVLLAWAVWSYNRFIQMRNDLEQAWADIDVQLKRRRDLIPSLVEVVKGYAGHESEVLENVTRMRGQTEQASGTKETAREESSLSDSISRLIARSEDYPDLKADKNFLELQNTLIDIEDDLQYARRYYNGTVRDFNIRCQSIPSLIIASLFGFENQDFFELKLSSEREVPDVEIE